MGTMAGGPLFGIAALVYGSLIPLLVMAGNLPSGLVLLFRQSAQIRGLGREILVAAMISLAAGTTAWSVGKAWMGSGQSGWFSKFLFLPDAAIVRV